MSDESRKYIHLHFHSKSVSYTRVHMYIVYYTNHTFCVTFIMFILCYKYIVIGVRVIT